MALSVRSVLVTGASRGLGLEFIRQLVALPSAPELVIAACRDPASAANLQDIAKSHSSVKVIKLDVEKDEDIESAFKETQAFVGEKGLNLLINNAGLNEKADGGGIYKAAREVIQRHFDVNVTGPIMISQKFLPLIEMAASQKNSKELNSQAAIIMISSAMGSQGITFKEGRGISLHYKCSKSAVNMGMILMSRELQDAGIFVNSLHPGWVRTDMGGPNADLTLEESVVGCLKEISSAREETNGKLVSWKGEILPY
ncbi:hypothetical protein EGW08_000513 [Elysia chlorotica]|uniref:C-factor n=1 Tax=Elysia chlorotica TaxID=188477 RepID=A0A3S1BY04_ELYCH|nr:hypothetical protein EGW08_000513 [Elysia chlorotica]